MTDPQLLLWAASRVTALGAFAALSISLVTGLGLRTAVLEPLASNRALRALHEFTAVLWIPLGAVHVVTIVLDQTARLRWVDVLVPFQAPYDLRGQVAIGLGTVTLELLAAVAVSGWLRRRLNQRLWRWTHRLAYAAFGLLFLHAVLAGTDFSDPAVSALTWSVAAALALLAAARAVWGRLPA